MSILQHKQEKKSKTALKNFMGPEEGARAEALHDWG